MVPVSTIPAVVDKMLVEVPYWTDWLMPQNSLAGEVLVIPLRSKSQLSSLQKTHRCQLIYLRECD